MKETPKQLFLRHIRARIDYQEAHVQECKEELLRQQVRLDELREQERLFESQKQKDE